MYFRNSHIPSGESKPLRDHVINEKQKVKMKGGRIGNLFWKNMRRRYKPGDLKSGMSSAGEGQVISQQLRVAMRTKDTTSRSKNRLIAWVRGASSIQEKEFLGICRLLHDSNPATQPKTLTLCVEVLKLVARTGSKVKSSCRRRSWRHHTSSISQEATMRQNFLFTEVGRCEPRCGSLDFSHIARQVVVRVGCGVVSGRQAAVQRRDTSRSCWRRRV